METRCQTIDKFLTDSKLPHQESIRVDLTCSLNCKVLVLDNHGMMREFSNALGEIKFDNL